MTEPLFATPTAEVARIALPVPVDSLFDYSVPPALSDEARPGSRVLVRFGSRSLVGVVVERAMESAFRGELRPIEQCIDSEPVLSPTMLDILREAAADVFCPVGLALASALPAGSAPRRVPGYDLTARGRAALESGAIAAPTRTVLGALASGARAAASLRGLGATAAATLAGLEADGFVVRREVDAGPTARIATARFARVAPAVDPAAALAALARAPRKQALFQRIAADGETPLAALAPEFATRLVRALEKAGWIAIEERAAPRNVVGDDLEPGGRPRLTADQEAATKPIVDAVRARRAESFLLHGVTGSGKTEVYLRAVGAALREGRQALVLVPEITLTHQILARLRGRFGDQLAVLHSGLRPGERLEQWQRLRAGATPIAVGARSALFAPLENLGVIVIDEEHDGAYKNDEGFRYHARDLARRRGARASCPVVLGSATPALETRFAADRGEIQRLVLAHRIGERPLPAVEIVDLVREREQSPRGRRVILGRSLRRAMRETLDAGAQTILFLNRRGFSTQILCFACGAAEGCPHCDVALVFHAGERVLRCHYCDHRAEPSDSCRSCGAPGTALLGLGTERVEEEVRSMFPSARVARLDRDTASRRGHTPEVLKALRTGEVDIVIGTQMVAKGHDFPGVRLVGVVAADVGLHMPDFRAAERTFQLLTQVAGRAGRDTAPGRVVVQTFVPDHYAIRPVSSHDYETFYEEELARRAPLRFPPFARLAHVVISAEDEAVVRAAGDTLARAADAALAGDADWERLGPAPAPLARLRGRHRHHILVKGSTSVVRKAAAAWIATPLPDGVQTAVDVDPMNML